MGLEILSQALSTQQVLERMSDTVNYRLRIGSGCPLSTRTFRSHYHCYLLFITNQAFLGVFKLPFALFIFVLKLSQLASFLSFALALALALSFSFSLAFGWMVACQDASPNNLRPHGRSSRSVCSALVWGTLIAYGQGLRS